MISEPAFEDYFQEAIGTDDPATIVRNAMDWYRGTPDRDKGMVGIQVCNMLFRVAVVHGCDELRAALSVEHVLQELVALHPDPGMAAFVEAFRSLFRIETPKRK
jgi:hypothetical protein